MKREVSAKFVPGTPCMEERRYRNVLSPPVKVRFEASVESDARH